MSVGVAGRTPLRREIGGTLGKGFSEVENQLGHGRGVVLRPFRPRKGDSQVFVVAWGFSPWFSRRSVNPFLDNLFWRRFSAKLRFF